MRSKKVSEAVEAFEALDAAQDRWNELFSELSEQEEAELEKRLFAQGVTFSKSDKPKEMQNK